MVTRPSSSGSGWQRFWQSATWWKAVVFVLAYLAVHLLGGRLVMALWGGVVQAAVLATPQSVFVGLVVPLLIGAVVLVLFVASVRWFGALFGRQPVPGRRWMWVFVAIAVVPVVLRLFGIDYARYGAAVVAVTFLMGVLVGFTEELVFRGIVVKLLRDAGHHELVVAVVSAALFALSHSVNALTGQAVLTVALTVVYTFSFGILMYLVMRVTGRLAWAMVVHGLTDPTTALATGGVDTATVGAVSPLLAIAAPFNLVIIAAGLVALFLIRGRVAGADGSAHVAAPADAS